MAKAIGTNRIDIPKHGSQGGAGELGHSVHCALSRYTGMPTAYGKHEEHKYAIKYKQISIIDRLLRNRGIRLCFSRSSAGVPSSDLVKADGSIGL